MIFQHILNAQGLCDVRIWQKIRPDHWNKCFCLSDLRYINPDALIIDHLQVFGKLKDINAGFQEKIVAVEGDVVDMDLGLSHADKSKVLESTSVIIHLAQISNCNSPLK